ncbi:MAG TPA: hypothetical protein VG711_05380, partial [Phycisphaerales bacterium]|nr:hypothetical protein [Phycisphaerales bacterium]
MGRTARFKIPMMADLVRQLQFTPAETLCRQMDNAERLAGEVEAGEKYPWEYVLFRITGFRTDRGQEPMLISGADVRSDAAIFVLRASSAADIERDYAGRSAIGLKALAKRLKVTGTTIQRYRTQGLICHAVRKRGKVRETHELVCFEDSLARFLAGLSRNGKEVGRLTRMSDAETEAAVQQARELREMKRASLNDAAKAIAERMGRSHEAVRQLLKRHDRDAEEAIFTERGPIGERGKEFVLRAWERGVSVGQIAKRLGKSSPAVHHALAQARAKRLKGWEISHVEMPTFELPDAERVILSSPWVSTGLMEAIASKITEVAAAQGMPELEENAEQAMVGGYNFLKRKAAQVIAGLGATPKIAEVDEAETLLRWAMLVKAKLVRGVMGSCIRQVERSLGKAFGTLR